MEPECLLPHSQVTVRDIQARTGSFLARRPNVTTSQETAGEGAAVSLAYSNSATSGRGNGAKHRRL